MDARNIVEHLPEGRKVQIGDALTHLLNLIPYAGGTLGSILNAHMTNKRFSKIHDTIKYLADEIEGHKTQVDKILKEDQAIELLEKTLSEIAKTSNEMKVSHLRNLLVNSYLKDESSFETKEFYLNLMLGLSIGEILLFQAVYYTLDPCVESIYPSEHYGSQNNLITANYVDPMAQYAEGEITFVKGEKTLLERLKPVFEGHASGMLDSAAFLLDSKGLTYIRDNLNDTRVKRIQMVKGQPFTTSIRQSHIADSLISELAPIEKSRTEVGLDFVKYIRWV